MPFIAMRDQTPLYVRTVGRGQPVLLLSGLGMHSRQWLPFVAPFIHRFRFVMPDFRGHGASREARLNQADVFQNHMEDVQDVIAHFGLQDFLLAGISMGCTTALHLRSRVGWEGVKAYLHIDQSPNVVNAPDWAHGLAGEKQDELFRLMHRALDLIPSEHKAEYFDELPRALQAEIAAELGQILELLGSGSRTLAIFRLLPQLPAVFKRRMPLLRLDDMRAYLTAYSGAGHDYRPHLDADQVPVTVMLGKHSILYAEEGQRLIAERAHRSRVVRFERSGHVPLMSEPLRFVQEFGRFLNDATLTSVAD